MRWKPEMNSLDSIYIRMFKLWRTLLFDRHFLSSFPIELSTSSTNDKFFCSFLTEPHELMNPRDECCLFSISDHYLSSGMECAFPNSYIQSTDTWHNKFKFNSQSVRIHDFDSIHAIWIWSNRNYSRITNTFSSVLIMMKNKLLILPCVSTELCTKLFVRVFARLQNSRLLYDSRLCNTYIVIICKCQLVCFSLLFIYERCLYNFSTYFPNPLRFSGRSRTRDVHWPVFFLFFPFSVPMFSEHIVFQIEKLSTVGSSTRAHKWPRTESTNRMNSEH